MKLRLLSLADGHGNLLRKAAENLKRLTFWVSRITAEPADADISRWVTRLQSKTCIGRFRKSRNGLNGSASISRSKTGGSPESQTHRTLQLFWHQWQHPLSEAILLPSEKRGVQMDESQESANQHDSGEIPAISGMASPTDAENLPRTVHTSA